LTSPEEIQRRYNALRAAMERDHLDALIVCGNQYAGFEGAVRYCSGFEIVHRYCYVILPLQGEPTLVFPKEARWRLRPRFRDGGSRLSRARAGEL